MSGRPLLFTFDNSDVAGRFIDGMLAIPNMQGVTITIPADTASNSEELTATDSQQLKAAIALCKRAVAYADMGIAIPVGHPIIDDMREYIAQW